MNEKTKNIIIVVLITIVLILCITMIFITLNERKVKYKYYDDDLIKIKNKTSLNVQANVLSQNQLAILVSGSTKNEVVTANIKVYDESNNQINKTEGQQLLRTNNNALITVTLPDLGDKYAGSIEIEITEEEASGVTKLDFSKLTYKVSSNINENGTTTINFQNNMGNKIDEFYGYVVALKNNKIVGFDSLYGKDVETNSSFNIDVYLPNKNTSANVLEKDYDNLILIISDIGSNAN